MNLRQKLAKFFLIKRFANLKITVACLVWLLILTFWGTVAQVSGGLYAAQKTFFYSWFFLAGGFFPLPGAQLTLWILFINLVSATITRHVFRWSNIGILIIHLGLLTYFVSAFVTFVAMKESQVTLLEGEGTNVSTAYHDWELAFWKSGEERARNVIAYDVKHLNPGEFVSDPKLKAGFSIKNYYPNASVFTDGAIKALPLDKEPERNFPAAVIRISSIAPSAKLQEMILNSANPEPARVRIDGEDWNMSLRRARYLLPLTITLEDFKAEFHPGTGVASSYESYVRISHEDLTRGVRIYMNHPLRFRDYTFFQASYSIDEMGRERSTFAVVKNAGRWLPYISSLLTFLGLAVHFLMRAFRKK